MMNYVVIFHFEPNRFYLFIFCSCFKLKIQFEIFPVFNQEMDFFEISKSFSANYRNKTTSPTF